MSNQSKATPLYVRPMDLHAHTPGCDVGHRDGSPYCIPVCGAADYNDTAAERDRLREQVELLASERHAFKVERDHLKQLADDARLTRLTIAGVLGFSAPASDTQLCAEVRATVGERDALKAENARLAKLVESMQAVVNAASIYSSVTASEPEDEDSGDDETEALFALDDALKAYRLALTGSHTQVKR